MYGLNKKGAGGLHQPRRSPLRGVVSRHDKWSCAGRSWRLHGGAVVVIAFLVVTVFGRPASAETIEQALADAYLINPVLNAERARLRATDEQVALAKSGLRPFVSGSADYGYMNTDNDVSLPRVGSPIPGGQLTDNPRRRGGPRGWWIPNGDQPPPRLVGATHPAAIRGLSEPQCHQAGEVDGAGGARSASHRRANGAARCRHHLRQCRARHGHRSPARERRHRAVRATQGDQGPLRCRRGHTHRRGAGRSPALRSARDTRRGPSQSQDRAARPTSRSSAILPATSSRLLQSAVCCRRPSTKP